MKKKLAVLLAMVMVVGVIGPMATVSAEESEPITIEFWNAWTGSDGDYLVEKVDEFNETNEWGITVNMDITSEFSERLATTLPVGECAPLILQGCADRFRYEEYMMPLDDIWDNTTLSEDDFNVNTIDVCKVGDTLYSVPFQNSLCYMYWNKDLFEAAGLDPESPPQSFDEWTEYAALMTDEDTNTYGSGLFLTLGGQIMALMGLDGGWAVTANDDGTWSVNIEGNEGYEAYLEWMKNLYDNGYNPIDDDIDSMFKAGQIAIMVNGPWLAAGGDEAGINFGMCKIFGNEPQGDVSGFFVTTSATEEEKLACERFIQWWYTGNEGTPLEETGAGIWSLSIGYPTAYLPLAETDAYKEDERVAALSLDDNSAESIWVCTDPNFPGWTDVETAMGTMQESVVYGSSIEDAMAAAQEEVEGIVITYAGEDALAK